MTAIEIKKAGMAAKKEGIMLYYSYSTSYKTGLEYIASNFDDHAELMTDNRLIKLIENGTLIADSHDVLVVAASV